MKLMVMLADGFEEIEALTVVDYLRRVDINVDMVSISDDDLVIGAHDIRVLADKKLSQIDPKEYQAVYLPGGLPGATNLRDNDKVIEILKYMDKEDKLVASICAGPIALARAEIIDGKKVTSFPGFEEDLKAGKYVEEKVVRDGNIITSRGPALAVEIALEIVRYLKGDKAVEELKDSILYNQLF